MMSILRVSLISVAIYLAVAQVCLCAHPLSKEENLKTLVQLRNDVKDLSPVERCDRYQDALRAVLKINKEKFGGKKFLTRAMDALSSYGGNFEGIRSVLDDLDKCINNSQAEDKTVGEDKTSNSDDQPQLEKVQGLGSALKAAQNLGILDNGHGGRHGGYHGDGLMGHGGGIGFNEYREHGMDVHGRHRDYGYHDEHLEGGHLGYGHGGLYHDKHHDMGYHGKHNNLGYHGQHHDGAYYDGGHHGVAGMYHEKQHGHGYNHNNKHNNFGYHSEHGHGLYGEHGVGHGLYGVEHGYGKHHNKHHYGGAGYNHGGLHGVGKTLKYTSAIEMAKIFYEYLNPSDLVANRCYKYYLLFSYPGQVSKKTIKTVAKLQVRVRNTEMLAYLVDPHYLHKFEQAAHMLAGTSIDFVRGLGKEMQICLADIESYRHSYGGVHMGGHGYYEGSHMSHGAHHGAHGILPAVSTSATTATAAAGAASASAASASG